MNDIEQMKRYLERLEGERKEVRDGMKIAFEKRRNEKILGKEPIERYLYKHRTILKGLNKEISTVKENLEKSGK